MSQREIICIICPLGCRVTLTGDSRDGVHHVTGNHCKEGRAYAIAESQNPVRVLTTTLPVENGDRRLVAVRADRPIPKRMIKQVMLSLSDLRVSPPIEMGQEIVRDVLGTGANIVATTRVR